MTTQLVFIVCLSLVIFNLQHNDRRDQWAGVVIICQIFSVYLSNRLSDYGVVQAAALYCVAGFAFVIFSTRRLGVVLGVDAFICSLILAAGHYGLISTERLGAWHNGGPAQTVWNYTTIINYLQLWALWQAGFGLRSWIGKQLGQFWQDSLCRLSLRSRSQE